MTEIKVVKYLFIKDFYFKEAYNSIIYLNIRTCNE